VLEEIRADSSVSYIPVIILTAARLDSSDIQSGLNLGADDYVTKPFDRHELMARIRTKLRVKEAEDVIRRRNKELNLLPEIGRELSARTDLKDLATILIKRTVETLGAIQGNIIVFGSESQTEQNYQVSLSPESSDTQMVIPESVIKHFTESLDGLIIADAHNDALWKTDVKDPRIHSAVIVPLSGRKKLLGLLVLTHEEERYFNAEHLLLLQAIASQAAIAIENARLYLNVEKEQQRLSAVLQSAANPILMFDANDCLALLNPAGEKLFTDYEAKIGMPLARKSGYDTLIELLEQVNVTNKPKTGELDWPDKRTFTALLTPIEGGDCVIVLQDVTHFKDVERVKNEFIATASHDLKNPLTSIVGYSQMLLQSGPLNETQTDFVNRIQHAGKSMNELVQNMLALAQVDLNAAQKHASVEMGALLATVADEFSLQASAKEQTFNFAPLQENAQVSGDPLQLKQLFRNLVGNAIKYTPPGGKITLRTKVEKGNLQVDVQDTGFGIPVADLPFIFNRFYRVREGKNSEMEGNGLGLAIVKSIVDQHGGKISVESEVDKGTRFSVSLPISAP
jgi:signal transduction histidine kinase